MQAEAEAQRRQDQLQLLQSKQDRTRSEEQRLFQHLTGLRKVAAGALPRPCYQLPCLHACAIFLKLADNIVAAGGWAATLQSPLLATQSAGGSLLLVGCTAVEQSSNRSAWKFHEHLTACYSGTGAMLLQAISFVWKTVDHRAVCVQDVAAGVGQAPINICADSVLLQLARMRPGSVAALSAVDGCTAVFREQHGQVGTSSSLAAWRCWSLRFA